MTKGKPGPRKPAVAAETQNTGSTERLQKLLARAGVASRRAAEEMIAAGKVRVNGVVVTEMVFAYPGFGRMLLDSSMFGDIATLEAATLVTVFVAVSTQFLGDLGYMLLNPRIRVR